MDSDISEEGTEDGIRRVKGKGSSQYDQERGGATTASNPQKPLPSTPRQRVDGSKLRRCESLRRIGEGNSGTGKERENPRPPETFFGPATACTEVGEALQH